MVNYKRSIRTKKRIDITNDLQRTKYKVYMSAKKLSTKFLRRLKDNSIKKNKKHNNSKDILDRLCTNDFKQSLQYFVDASIKHYMFNIEQVDEQVDDTVDEHVDEQVDDTIDEQVDEHVDEQVDDTIDEQVDELKKLVDSTYDKITIKLLKQNGLLHLFNNIIINDPVIFVCDSCDLNSNMIFVNCVVERVSDKIIRNFISSKTAFNDVVIILQGCILNECIFRNCRLYFIDCVIFDCEIHSTTVISENSKFINN
jgi:hypothetical protein